MSHESNERLIADVTARPDFRFNDESSPGSRGKTVMTKDNVWKVERKVGAAESLFGCCSLEVAGWMLRMLQMLQMLHVVGRMLKGGGVEFVGCEFSLQERGKRLVGDQARVDA